MSLTKVNRIRQCALWSAASFAAVGLVGSGLMWAVPAENSVGNSAQRATREIQDAGVGIVWLLVKDNQHPGAPGRLVAVDAAQAATGQPLAAGNSGDLSVPILPPRRRVLRGGDRILIEEDSPMVHLRLAGVALGPACEGQSLEARLEAGGKTVRVVALGPGRARLAQNPGAKP